MRWWFSKKGRNEEEVPTERRVRRKYESFRSLLALNNESLELMATLQEDLQYVPPRRDVLGTRVAGIFERAERIVGTLEVLTGKKFPALAGAVRDHRHEVENFIATQQELVSPRLAAWLSEVGAGDTGEVGGKAAALGEIKNALGLPVPHGYVLTTEAYRRFFGNPAWKSIRNALAGVDVQSPPTLQAASAELSDGVMDQSVPRAVEVAITERGKAMDLGGLGFAVRSSAVGEGGAQTFAGQFLSLLNVTESGLVDAYKRVVASRFSERALFYRLSIGLPEVDSPMAVLFLPVIDARAAGIMYTRDPGNPRSREVLITATRGLGLDIASGRMPADLFSVSRGHPHAIMESRIARKDEIVELDARGGLRRTPLARKAAVEPSLRSEEIQVLAHWAVRIEEHFKVPQDVEWALDREGNLWILQSRPLALAEASRRSKTRVREEPLLEGGRTVYPGRVSGKAYIARTHHDLDHAPKGAVVFMHRASPEIVKILPHISGVVAESGNIAGHGAALLREFKVPSVFEMPGALERISKDDAVSLDAVNQRVYRGNLWPPREMDEPEAAPPSSTRSDPISEKLLSLHLLDPSALNFRPRGCRSTHDVLRFSHEKAIEAMFAINDSELQSGPHTSKRLIDPAPINLYVLDLGGGLAPEAASSRAVSPSQIIARPFQAIWRGVSHPDVTWSRQMPASLEGLASVMAGAFSSHSSARRALGDRSYLLVADEYMNLNSRLAYHFTLVDACVSDVVNNNYVAFRFSGGGATRWRRNLRAVFIQTCLDHYDFQTDRRGDLVNAWFRKRPAEETENRLDMLGRLMACASQLDMYMTGHDVMQWYVAQFLDGNYGFHQPEGAGAGGRP